jgi:hypothetical protein
VHELIQLAQQRAAHHNHPLPVSVSYNGGSIPRSNVVRTADYILLHGNGVRDPKRMVEMIRTVRQMAEYSGQPIVNNEDDRPWRMRTRVGVTKATILSLVSPTTCPGVISIFASRVNRSTKDSRACRSTGRSVRIANAPSSGWWPKSPGAGRACSTANALRMARQECRGRSRQDLLDREGRRHRVRLDGQHRPRLRLAADRPGIRRFRTAPEGRSYADSPGNSGIQIRSRYDDAANWLDGPQVDLHPPGGWRSGLIYDETRGHQRWIFPSLENWRIEPAQGPQEWSWNRDGWNDVHIRCEGTKIVTTVNGLVIADYDGTGVLDDDAHQETQRRE